MPIINAIDAIMKLSFPKISRQITDIAEIVEEKDFNDKGELILRAGKKKYLRIVLQK